MAAGGASPGGSKGKAEKEREERSRSLWAGAPAPPRTWAPTFPHSPSSCPGRGWLVAEEAELVTGHLVRTPPDVDRDGSGERVYPDSGVTR